MSILVKLPGIEFEAGSAGEAIEIANDPKMHELSALTQSFLSSALAVPTTAVEVEESSKRKRRTKAEMEAARAAEEAPTQAPTPPVAPAPMPVPSVPNPGTGQDGMGIPPFLKREAEAPAPVTTTAAPTLSAPPAPVPPPAPMPAMILGPKIAAVIKQNAPTPESQDAYVKWLVENKIVVASGTFPEAMDVLIFTPDAKLTGIASALGVS